ncbi:aldo/keto reductase [Candidatus Soleaferrea massiliensis]|uniref:aldo/keto reductase n=1 Tax=Candidatus Soleaferrea massiliensis TaxID=1470354 RepID=UPI00058BAD58|nr:aldo/keto reductase [Candidatus Soleaferrea massiliensis]
MKYRTLGRTGLQVSEIGLGCEGFSGRDETFTKEMFGLALEHGVNCMDLYSPDPEMRSRIGRMLRGKRESFVMQAHLCTVWKDGQYQRTRDMEEVKASFEDLLTRLQTDYIDIGMIHYVDSVDEWKEIADGEVMQYAFRLKAEGRIRHVGISSHNPAAALAAVGSGLVDVLMFSVNPCYDLLPPDENCESLWLESSYEKPLLNMDPDREKLYETCQRLGVGITVMKAFGGGDLLSPHSPAGMALTVNQCIHYALTRPAVASVMSGVRSAEELQANLDYETASDSERDYASAFAALPKISWQGHCMYCGHCAPCPQGIDVATVTKFLNLSKAQGAVPETVREHYAALAHTADACIQCGACESRCPFGVPIRENMKEAAALFTGSSAK